MFQSWLEAAHSEKRGNRPPRREWVLPPGRLARHGMLVSACLLGLAWGGSALCGEPIRLEVGEDETADRTEVLIGTLENSLPAARREALIGLAAIGRPAAPAVPRLIDCLQDPDSLIRVYAARAAWRIGVDPAVLLPVLVELVDPAQPQPFGVAALVLGNIGPAAKDALPALQACLKAKSAVVRVRAAESILMIERENAASLHELLRALQDEQWEIRYLAANALGATAIVDKNAHAICAIEMALIDADPSVAAAAGINLFRLEDAPRDFDRTDPAQDGPSPGELKQLIADLSHSSAVIRRMSAVRLGMAGHSAEGALEALHDCLEDDDPTVQVQAANAVWAIEREPDLVPQLVELVAYEKPSVSIAAACVLGRMRVNSRGALPVLRERLVLTDGLEHLFLAVVVSRIDPDDQVALGMLLADLHNSEGDLRYLSALMLADLPSESGSCRIRTELFAAMSDQNLRVQSAAVESLKLLRSRRPQKLTRSTRPEIQTTSTRISSAPLPRRVPGRGETSAAARDDSVADPLPSNGHVPPAHRYNFTGSF